MNPSQLIQLSSSRAGTVVASIGAPHLRTPEVSYAVRDELTEMVSRENAKNVILDLDDVTYVGSVGLLGLLALRRLESVKEIVECNLSPDLKSMFLQCCLISDDAGRMAPFGYAESLVEALEIVTELEE